VKRIKVIVPITTDQWNEETKDFLDGHKNPDTSIDVVSIKQGPDSIDGIYDAVWAKLFTVLEAEKAETECYDGVIIYCSGDPGLRAAKEKLTIPVVGLNEPAIHVASILGRQFSIITTGPPTSVMSVQLADNVRMCGFESKCASIRSIGMAVLDLGENKEEEAQRAFQEAKQAIEQDGADVIVLGCGAMFGVEERITKELGVPVVVPGAAALKVCEDLIELKLTQSKRRFALPLKKQRTLQGGGGRE